MNQQHVFEAYIRDVARNLPGKTRYEVAQDLRAQLADELAGRAEETGRAPDGEMALEIVRGFGRPDELAAQYHTPFAIIEPTATRRFIVFVVIGYGLLSTLAVTLDRLDPNAANDVRMDGLSWIGACTILFGVVAWLRRRKPQQPKWTPKARIVDIEKVNFATLAVSAAATLFLLVAYIWPGPVVELFTAGRVPSNALAYDPQFSDPRYLRFPWLIGVLVYILGVFGGVAFQGRWTRLTRWLYIFGLFHLALQLGWHMTYPAPVFASAAIEDVVFPVLSMIILGIGIDLWLRVLREWEWIEPPNSAT